MAVGTRLRPFFFWGSLPPMSDKYQPGFPASVIAGFSGFGQGYDNPQAPVSGSGLSERQMTLNKRWATYRTQQYDHFGFGWDGKQRPNAIEHEQIVTMGYLAPGFADMGASLPLKYRAPETPYHLPRVIVDRFTSLLFSSAHHPRVVVEGDPEAEDYLSALAEASRLWSKMIQARAFGGGTGTAVFGFKFVDGQPRIEVHDPRWCYPTWKDQEEFTLLNLEIRYQYPKEIVNPETKEYETVGYWHRRVITEKADVTFVDVEVSENGDPPQWVPDPAKTFQHDYGFCPVVWVQNMPLLDDIDGDPDCIGVFDLCEAIDRNLSQGNTAVSASCDPTLVAATDADLPSIGVGLDNAIKVPVGSTVTYLEANMNGPKAAFEQAERLRKMALEIAQCVLDHPGTIKTATEVILIYSSMLSKADVMREQYGEKGIKPLLRMMIRAIHSLGGADKAIILPPKIEKAKDADGKPVITKTERVLPDDAADAAITLSWPAYFPPDIEDAGTATTAAAAALLAKVIDKETAVKFVAPFYGVEDPSVVLDKLKAESAAGSPSASDVGMGGVNAMRAKVALGTPAALAPAKGAPPSPTASPEAKPAAKPGLVALANSTR